jgi:hypothetical protein
MAPGEESEAHMARWEYRVMFVDGWRRTSIEGNETHPEEGERTSGFARRSLNTFGAEGWELVGIQHAMPGQSYYIFKRPLDEGAAPDVSVARSEERRQEQPGETPPSHSGSEVVSL